MSIKRERKRLEEKKFAFENIQKKDVKGKI